MLRQKHKSQQPSQAPANDQGAGQAEQTPAWSPPGGSTARARPSLRATNKNPTRTSYRVTSYPDPGAGYLGDPNLKGQPKTTSYPKTAGNVGHRGYQSIN